MGKSENGIAEPIKPKLKFDVTGVGHKNTDDNWWQSVYNKASQNVTVEKDSAGVSLKVVKKGAKIFSKNEDLIEIQKKHASGHKEFIKTSTLENGITVEEEKTNNLDANVEFSIENLKISDEELFKACGGRTAHKGARHGLSLSGKLARIALQEEELSSSATTSENNNNNNYKKTRTKKKETEKEDLLQEELTKKEKKKRKRKTVDEVCKEDVIDDDDDKKEIAHLMNNSKSHKSHLSKSQRKTSKRKITNLVEMLDKSCTLEENKPKSRLELKRTYKKRKTDEIEHFKMSDDLVLQASFKLGNTDDDYLTSFKEITFKRYEEQDPNKFIPETSNRKGKIFKTVDKLSEKLSDICSLNETTKKKKKKCKKFPLLDEDEYISKIDVSKLNSRIEKKKKKRMLKGKLKEKIGANCLEARCNFIPNLPIEERLKLARAHLVK